MKEQRVIQDILNPDEIGFHLLDTLKEGENEKYG
jgi:hypothetical protein